MNKLTAVSIAALALMGYAPVATATPVPTRPQHIAPVFDSALAPTSVAKLPAGTWSFEACYGTTGVYTDLSSGLTLGLANDC